MITIELKDSGNLNGTSATVPLASYDSDDFIIFTVSSNQARTYTFSENVTATPIGTGSGRVAAWRIVPDTSSEASFTVTSTNAIWTWTTLYAAGVDASAPIDYSFNAGANNTTYPLETPDAILGYISTGREMGVSIASVNATATWTPGDNTIFYTTGGNAATLINASIIDADLLTVQFEDADRGLDGTTRLESSLGFVLQEAPIGTQNLLSNPSFETGALVATGWETEGNTTDTPQYLTVTSGVTDGRRAQNIQYNGQAGDSGQVLAIYQAPIDAQPGDVLEFSIDISGSKANCVMIVGIEDFLTGGTYISETDTVVDGLTGTPQTFTVQHTCAENTDYVAVYIQVNEIYQNANLDVTLDNARLILVPQGGLNIKIDGAFSQLPTKIKLDGSFTEKTIKIKNDGTFVELS